jgi:hypothetical protein
MKEGAEIIRKHDLSSLRHLASVGEPLNHEAVIWSEVVLWKTVPRHLLANRDRLHRDNAGYGVTGIANIRSGLSRDCQARLQ